MVLIFSDTRDSTTALVLDWLIHLGETYKVIHTCDVLTIQRVELQPKLEFYFTIASEPWIYKTSDFTAVWYRRNYPTIQLPQLVVGESMDEGFRFRLQSYWATESEILRNDFLRIIARIPSIGSPFHCGENTLRDLTAYAKAGGVTPKTIITSAKQELKDFLDCATNGVICKKLNYSFHGNTKLGYFGQYTEVVDYTVLDRLPDHFGATLFQEKVPKYVELRIFVLVDKLFAMAIFSQSNARTAIDSRHNQALTRTAPYVLPEFIQAQIQTFMKEIGTNTGSIDMVLTPDNEYVFLEINTIGQFGFVSQGCNYQFEKHIAHELRRFANTDLGAA